MKQRDSIPPAKDGASLQVGLALDDRIDIGLRGHFKLEAYVGDVARCKKDGTMRVADRRGRPTRLHAKRAIIPEWEALGKKGDEHVILDGAGWEGHNLIVTVGKQMIMDRLFGLSSVAAVTACGVGTSNTSAAVGDTALTGGVFKNFDATPIRSSLSVPCITTFTTTDANINWQELALRNATPTLLNRIAPIGPFNKTSAVSIVVTVTITQT